MCYVVRNIRAGIIFKQKRSSCKKKELRVNLTSNTFQRKYENFDKILSVLIYPKNDLK